MRPLLTEADARALQAQIARLREDARRRREEAEAASAAKLAAERAAFTGDCFVCRDTGVAVGTLSPCVECDRGRAIAGDARQRRLDTILDAANLPPRCASFTLATYPAKNIAAYRALCEFLRDWDGCQSLLLNGQYGVGKTGLIVAALRAVAEQCADGLTTTGVFFTTGVDLLDALRRGYDDGTFTPLMDRAKSVAVLAIDDLGAERMTEWVIERLFAIINARYDACLPTFVTTNFGLEDLAERIGARSFERLVETSRVITVDGPNLRLRKQGV
ncbi:MAG TPA: ATP-binding protein [Ktedonobacterales bacterium]|nr:ATP-binding protein [Ktedonobacterales bacterium]